MNKLILSMPHFQMSLSLWMCTDPMWWLLSTWEIYC